MTWAGAEPWRRGDACSRCRGDGEGPACGEDGGAGWSGRGRLGCEREKGEEGGDEWEGVGEHVSGWSVDGGKKVVLKSDCSLCVSKRACKKEGKEKEKGQPPGFDGDGAGR